ncbi:MAG: sulfatase, partial [Verrucomicrobiales bacterium]|nr:sulfatase [Verrucomicrobiales bacterium]
MNRFLLYFSVICLALTSLSSAKDKLNFIFFLADDLGYNDVGFNNRKTFYETPNLDALAASGMVFTDFYAASQVCSPTRASIMTGKYPARTDTTNYFSGRRNGTFGAADFETVMAPEEVTIAEALKENGYQTFFAGKWHLGGDGHLPTDQGFDINKGGGSNGLPRSYFSPYKNVENLPPGPEGEFLTGRLASESIDFLNQAAKTPDPFLLYLSFYSVHTPLQAPKHLVEKYKAKALKLNIHDEEGSFDVGGERQVWPDAKEKRKVRIRQDHAVYAAMVESLDTAVGRVLQRLDELNLRDNTAIIFMSDNGGTSTSEGHPTSNLPLRGGKGWMYEGGIREPVVVRWPGVTASGTRCQVPAVSTDFYPTILEMAGLEARPDQHLDGVSIVPLLRNPFAKFDRG